MIYYQYTCLTDSLALEKEQVVVCLIWTICSEEALIIHREMNTMFNAFNNLSKNAPKDLVRDYQTSDGAKVREIGPIVYGYSITIGSNGKPHVKEFGNVKDGKNIGQYVGIQKPQITAERVPMFDVTSTDKEVKVVLEMPGITKEDIKINAYDEKVEVNALLHDSKIN